MSSFNLASFGESAYLGSKPEFSMQTIFKLEEKHGEALGNATADDVILFARRAKEMRAKLLILKKDVDALYDMKVNGRSLDEILRSIRRLNI